MLVPSCGLALVAGSCSSSDTAQSSDSQIQGSTLATVITDEGPSPGSTIVETASQLDLGKDPLILFGPVPPMPAVTPGDRYEFRAKLAVPEASIGTAVVAVAFLDEQEVRRHTIRFEPRFDPLAPPLTNEAGITVITVDSLTAGRYQVEARYEGDLERWPSSSSAVIDIP